MTIPDWLAQRGGTLRLGRDGLRRWFVVFGAQITYSLAVVPVAGALGCVVRQTNNGQRIDCATGFATEQEALNAGLEALRLALGWA